MDGFSSSNVMRDLCSAIGLISAPLQPLTSHRCQHRRLRWNGPEIAVASVVLSPAPDRKNLKFCLNGLPVSVGTSVAPRLCIASRPCFATLIRSCSPPNEWESTGYRTAFSYTDCV